MLQECVFDDHWQQVRIGEVTVVVGFLLAAHGTGFVSVRVVQAGLLNDLTAVFDQVDLALDLAVDRLLDEAERVDVLDLAARPVLNLAFWTNRHVAVATQRAFGHVAVADAEVANQRVHGLDVGDGFFGRTHVRLGNDFQQRRTGAVQIDAGHAAVVFVQALAGVFFKVGAGHADALDGAVFQGDVQVAFAHDRQFHLTDLITLRQVRVEVILAGEHVVLTDLGVDGQAKLDRHLHGFLVQHRQRTGHAQVDEAGLSVGLGAERGGATGENLRLGGELGMNLQPDDDFPLHVFSP